MLKLLALFGKWQGFKGDLARMPALARLIVGLAALPGILLVLLSILAFLVSLLALFLLTTPVYRILSWLTGFQARPDRFESGYSVEHAEVEEDVNVETPAGAQVVVDPPREEAANPSADRPRRHIDVKIVE